MNWSALVINGTLCGLVVADNMPTRLALAFLLMFPIAGLILRVEK